MTYELGTGRIAFANNEMETARKHFQNALDAGNGGLPGVANLGQTRRFRTAARTSLGDVALREGRYKDAAKMFTDAASGAKKDNRLDLMWPAQRGLGRSLWLQAAQDPKGGKQRDDALNAYTEALKTIETIRAGSLRADESRSTFLATTKDVYDEAASAFAEMALLNSPSGGALSGKSLDYAAESFRITEAGRARSLLDMLGEVNAQITEGVPADLLRTILIASRRSPSSLPASAWPPTRSKSRRRWIRNSTSCRRNSTTSKIRFALPVRAMPR